MIPILFDANAKTFTTNGLGRLSDCISCLVTEERNGIYEVEFDYPITGIHYDLIEVGKLIYVSHDEVGDKQPFVIYRRSAEINGLVTFNAHHVSYKLSNVIMPPVTASSISSAFSKFETEAMTENAFTFWTDKSSTGNFKIEVPSSIRSVLAGEEGSILDVFGGGEYEFDNYTVKLYQHRGSDNGVTIRYGKNLIDLKQEIEVLDLYNSVIPYWQNEDDVVYGGIVKGDGGIEQESVWTEENNVQVTDESKVPLSFKYMTDKIVPLDLSEKFEDAPTVAQLEAAALSYLNSNTPWVPHVNIDIDFVALWQTEEYKDIAPLERVKLCDTVTVKYPALGVSATAKVISVTWDALKDKYSSIQLGDAQTSFADVIQGETNKKIEKTATDLEAAIEHASDLITGGLGGHIVYVYDANGKPSELLVMDTDDISTAVNVLRMNVNGIGFSSNGINGPYRSAWTLDGAFVADFITAGTMSANRLRTGIIASADNLSYWDLDGSELKFYDKSFDSYVKLDEGYIEFGHGNTVFGKIFRNLLAGKDLFTIKGDPSFLITSEKGTLRMFPNYTQLIQGTDMEVYLYDNGSNSKFARLKCGDASIVLDDKSGLITIKCGDNTIKVSGNSDYVSMFVNDSKIRIYDNDEYQFIDMNSGGDTYIRVDGKSGDALVNCGDFSMNGYSGYDGQITIGSTKLNVHKGIISSYSTT